MTKNELYFITKKLIEYAKEYRKWIKKLINYTGY